MALAYRSQTNLNSGTSASSSHVFAKPAGAVEGDLLVCFFDHVSGSTSVNVIPADWTQTYDIANTSGGFTSFSTNAFWKIAGAAEPVDYTFGLSSAQRAQGVMLCYSGALPGMVIADVMSSNFVNASTTATAVGAPSVTTTVDGSLLVTAHHVGYNVVGATWTPPTGMTERSDDVSSSTTTSMSMEVNELILGAAGATGAQTATASVAGYPTAITLTFPPGPSGPPPQLAYAASDISDGAWLNQAGSNVNLFASIDEVTADDADWIQSDLSPATASPVTVGFGPLTDPVVHTGHVIRYRPGKDVTGGDVLNFTAHLYQGATLIASDVTRATPDAFTTYSFTLTEAQAGAITSYSDLRIVFSVIKA